MADGWISVHRKIEECWVWFDEPFSKGQAWIDLLLLVNHAPKKCVVDGVLTEIGEGERLTSIRKLAERWQWSRDKVTKFLSILEKDEMIELKKSHHFTIIKVLNYGLYQGEMRKNTATKKTPNGHRTDTERTQTDTNNNENNEKNENKNKKGGARITDEIKEDFEKIIAIYPNRKGKAEALESYAHYVTDGKTSHGIKYKFTNKQIYYAVRAYVTEQEENETDIKYYKHFSTLMNNIMDYVKEDKK